MIRSHRRMKATFKYIAAKVCFAVTDKEEGNNCMKCVSPNEERGMRSVDRTSETRHIL
jgi:hypothetical protein